MSTSEQGKCPFPHHELPKENSPHSYMILEDCVFTWKDLETLSQYRYKEFPKSK